MSSFREAFLTTKESFPDCRAKAGVNIMSVVHKRTGWKGCTLDVVRVWG